MTGRFPCHTVYRYMLKGKRNGTTKEMHHRSNNCRGLKSQNQDMVIVGVNGSMNFNHQGFFNVHLYQSTRIFASIKKAAGIRRDTEMPRPVFIKVYDRHTSRVDSSIQTDARDTRGYLWMSVFPLMHL